MTTAWKKLHSILSVRSDFHITDSLSITVHAFANCVSISVSVDKTLLPRWVNLSTSFRELPLSVEMLPVWLKHIYSILCALIWRPMPAVAHSRQCSRVSAWVGAFARSTLVVWSNFNFLHYSQWITFPTQSCLLHSLMWFMVLSLSLHYHLLFCCVLSSFTLT